VDKILGGGLRRGDLIVIGGDVGSGKSAFALALALRAAQAAQTAAVFTAEMSVDRVMERALAIEGRARIDDIRRGSLDEGTRAGIGAAAVRLREQAPKFERLSDDGFETLAEDLRRDPDLEVAVIDSLQSLAVGSAPHDEELGTVTRRLKTLAVDLGLALVVTAHLPLLDRSRHDRRPTLDDFGARGAVKQHADVVLSLFREEMYQASQGVEGATELHVLKNRNGGTGYVDLYFYKQWMRFEDMLDPDR
jgi:replicative DNA helicase